jgi:citrate/tricarballylate utilization protein
LHATETTAEARRQIEICNACRYCEGFCAVFPAMTLHRSFSDGEIGYLANLCHNCKGCYYACQFAPPHEFAINIPAILSDVRTQTYADYVWPRPLAAAFARNGIFVSVVTCVAIILVLLLTMLLAAPGAIGVAHTGPGAFYAVIPWGVMSGVAGAVLLFTVLALGIGVARFWRDHGIAARAAGAPGEALSDVLTLRNLGGGVDNVGCNDRDEAFSHARRHAHHAMFYGFLLCFASTASATVYADLFGWAAPYGLVSVPVLLGLFGGIGMLAGGAGLFWVKLTADREPASPEARGGEFALLGLLMLAAATGLLLLLFRDTAAMGALLALHLGVILAVFLLLPYSRFAHGVYRSAALLRHAIERRTERPVGTSS